MSSILLTPPEVEPIALAEAKHYLRVEHADDDDIIAALIAGARIHVEALTRRALIAQTWRLVRNRWPADGRIAVFPVPLRALAAARVCKADGTAQALDVDAFNVDTVGGVLSLAPGVLPAPGRVAGGIELDIDAGYGEAPDDVPEPLRQAIRMLAAHWYENRGVTGEHAAVLPQGVTALLAPFRAVSL
ncbi:MAG: hypothetical protein FJX62_13270 [Alphaproteobacteria bacterium]|nr:hypothetical protein [Alphaproteobacteria bacterium]